LVQDSTFECYHTGRGEGDGLANAVQTTVLVSEVAVLVEDTFEGLAFEISGVYLQKQLYSLVTVLCHLESA
jgi:hypothetical protein